MSQEEEEELPPAPPMGRTRVQALQGRIDLLAGDIRAAALEIISIGKNIRALIGVEGKEADRTKLEAQQAKLETQQAELKALLKPLQDELAKLEGTESQRVEDAGRILPKALTDNLPKMLFAVLDRNAQDGTTRNPVGVSFFVRPTLAITAFHVLKTHYPGIVIGNKVYLLREAGLRVNWKGDKEEEVDGPNLIETTLVNYNPTEDWALMKLSKPTANIRQFEIGDAADARWSTCQMLGYNIGLSSAEDIMHPHITNALATPHDCETTMFLYSCLAYEGDSGGAVVVSATGKVVAMHCELINAMKEPSTGAATTERRKKTRNDVVMEVKANLDKLRSEAKANLDELRSEAKANLDELRSEVSSGKSQGVFRGIRLDYMQKQGYFDGY